MAALLITSENQIQRLNHLIEQVKEWQKLDVDILIQRSNNKAWSIVEIIEHMSIAYGSYVDKVSKALDQCPEKIGEASPFRSRTWQKLVIQSQRPKDGQRKWKMKTLKQFEPHLTDKVFDRQSVDDIFTKFYQKYDHLYHSILKSRQKDVKGAKFSSAIGPIVNFYLPECFEFVLGHAERHMVQIQEMLIQLPK